MINQQGGPFPPRVLDDNQTREKQDPANLSSGCSGNQEPLYRSGLTLPNFHQVDYHRGEGFDGGGTLLPLTCANGK